MTLSASLEDSNTAVYNLKLPKLSSMWLAVYINLAMRFFT